MVIALIFSQCLSNALFLSSKLKFSLWASTGEKGWPKRLLSHQLPHKERDKTFLSTLLLQLLLEWSTAQIDQRKEGGEQRQKN